MKSTTKHSPIQWLDAHAAILWQLVGPLLFFGVLLIKGEVIYWGTAYLQFLPWRYAAWNMIQEGIFPLWNSANGMGAPLFANYQSALLYPPNLLVYAAAWVNGIKGIATAQTVLVMLHICASGIGFVLLMRNLGVSKTGQTIAGLAFSLSGYFIARASFLSINAALVWIPWMLLASYKWIAYQNDPVHRTKYGWYLLHVVFIFCQLMAGHAQTSWYTQIIIGLWIAIWSLKTGKMRGFARGVLTFLIIGIAAIGLSMVQLLPTIEYLLNTQRASEVDYVYAVNYSFWPWRWLTVISANLFGNPARGNYWVTADNYWEDAVYIGVLPIILVLSLITKAIFGKIDSFKKVSVVFTFGAALCLVGAILAAGKYLPIFPLLYKYIPTFDMFQGPARWMILWVTGASMLAGISVDYWNKPKDKTLYWSRLAVMGGFAAVLAAIAANLFLQAKIENTYLVGTLETSILLFVCALFNLTKGPSIQKKTIWNQLLLAFIAFDLVYAGWGLNPGVSRDLQAQIPETQVGQRTDGRLFIPVSSEEKLKFIKYFRFDSFLRPDGWEAIFSDFIPNMNLLSNLDAVNNFDPFTPARFAKWMDMPQLKNNSLDMGLLNLMNVSAVQEVKDDTTFETGWTRISGSNRYRVFNCAISSQSETESYQQFQKLLTEKTTEKVVVVEKAHSKLLDCNDLNNQITIVPRVDQPNYQRIMVTSASSGWFMQSDTWYPGWTVKMDGQPVELHKMDYLFRGVAIEAGTHTIEFVYNPLSFIVGLTVSICSLIVLILLSLILLNPKRSRQ